MAEELNNAESNEVTPETTPAPEAAASTPEAPAVETPTAEAPADGVDTAGEEEQIVATSTRSHKVPTSGLFWGTGRRKTSVARVRIMPGEGKLQINKRDLEKYFTEEIDRERVLAPLKKVGAVGKYNVFVNVKGGGITGQSSAILLGLSRALATADSESEPLLREAGYMTRDARRVERKKYGRRKARRRFQFSKR